MSAKLWQKKLLFLSLSLIPFVLTGCSDMVSEPMAVNDTGLPSYHGEAPYSNSFNESKFASMMPAKIRGGERVVLVDPKAHAWAAYDKHGDQVRAGIAQAGADFCPDEGRPCRTDIGTYRIYSMGDMDCISHKYPIDEGGGSLMPYCMFFHNGESLHGTPDQMLSEANTSHGCVHMRIPDAEWLRYNFIHVGTKIVVLPYDHDIEEI